MFAHEHRAQVQVSRDAAERFAMKIAIAERRVETKRVRRERKSARRIRAAVAHTA